MESTSSPELPLVLGPSGRLRAVTSALAGLGMVAAVWFGVVGVMGDSDALRTSLAIGIQTLILTLPRVLVAFKTKVVIDADAISVSGLAARTRGTWQWSDVKEVCLVKQQGDWSLGIRPDGSIWDMPGPQSPAVTPVVFGSAVGYYDARNVLQNLCDEHGIPFSDEVDGLGSAPPGSSLRS